MIGTVISSDKERDIQEYMGGVKYTCSNNYPMQQQSAMFRV